MKTTLLNKDNLCPACNGVIDAATDSSREQIPEKDDYSICLKCSVVLRFNEDLSSRLATKKEIKNEPLHVKIQIMRIQEIIQDIIKNRDNRNK